MINFNKTALIAFGLLGSTSISSYAALDQSGVIKLNGYIYSATCTLDINDQGPSLANINMGRYSTSEFNGTNSEVGGTGENGKVNVTLTDCPDNGTVTLTFDGTIGDKNTILKLDNPNDSGTAKNVGVHLYNISDLTTPLVLDGSQSYSQQIQGESASWTGGFIAKYVSTASNVTAGQANASINYKIIYN